MWFVLIIVVIAFVLWKCSGNQSKETKSSPQQSNQSKSVSMLQIDKTVVDRIVFLESVAIELAYNRNPNLMNSAINHGFIRCAAGDFNGMSYVEFSASTYNINKGWDELRQLITEQSLSNAEKFLKIAGFQSINASDFLQYIKLTKIDLQFQNSGWFSVKYEPEIPYGLGQAYHDKIYQRLKEKWPYSPFECDMDHIDLSI